MKVLDTGGANIKVLIVASAGTNGCLGQLCHLKTQSTYETSAYGFGEAVEVGRVSSVIDIHRGLRFAIVLTIVGVDSQQEWGIWLDGEHCRRHLAQREMWLIPEDLMQQIPRLNLGNNFWDNAIGVNID